MGRGRRMGDEGDMMKGVGEGVRTSVKAIMMKDGKDHICRYMRRKRLSTDEKGEVEGED